MRNVASIGVFTWAMPIGVNLLKMLVGSDYGPPFPSLPSSPLPSLPPFSPFPFRPFAPFPLFLPLEVGQL